MRVSRVVSDMKKHRPCLRACPARGAHADTIGSIPQMDNEYSRVTRVIFYSRLRNNSLDQYVIPDDVYAREAR